MAASWSRILTLIIVLFAGPISYGLIWMWKKFVRKGGDSSDNYVEGEKEEPVEEPLDKDDVKGGQNEQSTRETMESSEYLFALVGYAIGIGNLWRFPYVIAQNGGSACLIAYLICLILGGCPTLFL